MAKELQKLLSTVRQAAEHYDMIVDGDLIAVGLSGGKDSGALLLALSKMRSFYPKKFSLCAVTVDMGFDGSGESHRILRDWCASLDTELHVVRTEIAKIVFEERREKNPCSLCAKMRRGALIGEALRLGSDKIALGHHLEDAAETLMMSMIHEGRIGSFMPVTVYEDTGISVIRPLIYTREADIKSVVRAENVPVIESLCPENGETERADMKALLKSLEREHRGVYRRLIGALEKQGLDGWKA